MLGRFFKRSARDAQRCGRKFPMILACGPNARHTLIQARIRVSSTGTTKSQILAWPGSNCEQKKEEPPDVFGQDLPDGWKEGTGL